MDHTYGATTVVQPTGMPQLCLEDDEPTASARWTLLFEAERTAVLLEGDQVRALVVDYVSQVAGGPFEDKRDAERIRTLTDTFLSTVADRAA